MLYSDEANLKLHIVVKNPAPVIAGMPMRLLLSVNHVSHWERYEAQPSEILMLRYRDWRIAGDKRKWQMVSAQEIAKPALRAKVEGARVTNFFVTLEQVITNPEKELDVVPHPCERGHLRRFNNLILDDE